MCTLHRAWPSALGQQPPAAFYHPSPRSRPERPAEPWYDPWHAVRQVRTDGSIKWGEPLAGETVGIAETESGHWIVRFRDIDLGIIDQKTKKPRNFTASGQPGRANRKQNKP